MRPERIDRWIVGASAVLLLFGVVMAASASLDVAAVHDRHPWRIAGHWVAYAALGVLCGAALAVIPPERWRPWSFPALIVSFVLLLAVHLPGIGREVNGAARWLAIGGLTVQPAEFAKVALVVYLAHYLDARAERLGTLAGWGPMLFAIGALEVGMLSQPDFGDAALLIGVAAAMAWVGGVRLRHLALFGALGGAALAALAVLVPYRWQRLVAFVDPWSDPFDTGYQLAQSLLAYGAGGWLGVGVGQGVQKLFYLPEVFTDFVAAALAEEMGFVGVAALILAFAVLVLRALVLAVRASTPYRRLLLVGAATSLGLAAMVNLGVTMGLLPTKGLPLPFVSYGGSALVADGMLVGLMLAAARPRQGAAR